MNEEWDRLWQSRSFFNPAEAAIEIILNDNNTAHLGSIAVDAEVPSLIHYLGRDAVDNTKVSEDYILFSEKYNMPVLFNLKLRAAEKHVMERIFKIELRNKLPDPCSIADM